MGSTYQSIIIQAAPQQVWDAIKDFHDLSWSPNVVTSVDVVGDKGGAEIGARRVLNGIFHETLHELDEAGHTFAYSIDEAPSPISSAEISDYMGRVAVKPAADGTGTMVEWSSSWQNNDDEGYEFCHPIYVALLDDMRASLEGA